MKFSDFLIREAIIADLQAMTKEAAIREIVRSVQDAGHLPGVDLEAVTRSFLRREGLGSTAIGQGLAVPHGETDAVAVDRVLGTVALSRTGVEFDAVDGQPVNVIFLLLHDPGVFKGRPVAPRGQGIYGAFNLIAPHIKDTRLLDRLRQCRTREEIVEVFDDLDREAR